MESSDEIWVVTTENLGMRDSSEERFVRETQLNVAQLSGNINIFLNQVDGLLSNVPANIGKFEFSEFEFYAEVTSEGTVKLLGTGVGVSGSGGLKFVFRRRLE